MVLEAAKCPNCDGNVELDPKNTFMTCKYCGSNIFVKDAIDAYKEEQKKEYRLKIADECLEKGIVDDAEKIYKEISKEFPNDYRGWWGIIRSNPIEANRFDPMDDIYKKAIAFAPKNVSEEIEKHHKTRLDIINKHKFLRNAPGQIKNLQKKSDELNENINICKKEIESKEEEINKLMSVRIPESKKAVIGAKASFLFFSILAAASLMIAIFTDDNSTKLGMVVLFIILFFAAYACYSNLKEEKESLKKIESELPQKSEEKSAAEKSLSEAQKAIDDGQKKVTELEAEIEKIKAELSEC